MIDGGNATRGIWGRRGITCGAKQLGSTESRPIFLGINDLHVNAGVGETLF